MSSLKHLAVLFASDYRAHYAYKHESRPRARLSFLPRLLSNPSLHAVLLVRLITGGPSWLKPLWRNILLGKHSSDVSDQMTIGPGLDLPHPWGIVLGQVSLGKNCVVYHNVTMGVRAPHLVPSRGVTPDLPSVGDDVIIYCGAVILGKVHIGDRAVIGAHVLVTESVPPYTIVSVVQSLAASQDRLTAR